MPMEKGKNAPCTKMKKGGKKKGAIHYREHHKGERRLKFKGRAWSVESLDQKGFGKSAFFHANNSKMQEFGEGLEDFKERIRNSSRWFSCRSRKRKRKKKMSRYISTRKRETEEDH